MEKRILEFVRDMTRMLACLTLIATAAAALARVYWMLELTSHFRVQYLFVSLLCAVVLSLFRDCRWSVAALAGVLINGAAVFPWYLSKPTTAPETPAKTFRVLLSNVFTANRNSAALLDLIQSESPDLVVLEEIDGRWAHELQSLDAFLPHRRVIPRGDNFGIGLWSRFPLTELGELTLSETDVPSILAKFQWSGKSISLLATHPLPPGSKHGFEARNEQLKNAARLARNSQTPFIVLGDLNITMFSPYYADFIRDSAHERPARRRRAAHLADVLSAPHDPFRSVRGQSNDQRRRTKNGPRDRLRPSAADCRLIAELNDQRSAARATSPLAPLLSGAESRADRRW